jgi:hypothetical protein
MSVKANVESTEKKIVSYPKLRKSNLYGTIVLFVAPRMGTVVSAGGGGNPIGYHSDSWSLESFEDFDGTVTLQNEK